MPTHYLRILHKAHPHSQRFSAQLPDYAPHNHMDYILIKQAGESHGCSQSPDYTWIHLDPRQIRYLHPDWWL